MTQRKIISFENIRVACRSCSLNALCLPMGLSSDDIEKLENVIKRSRPLQRGEHLFYSGEHFHSLFVVKTGSVKTYTPSTEGGEQVLGFHLPGELIGLDAINQNFHSCSARVLETSAICEIPFQRLEELASNLPSLQHQLYRLLSKEIVEEAEMLMLLGKRSAEERLAAFLVSLSQRLGKRGLSTTDFHLSMSRHEIGNYLGLAVETVSRLFSRFQDENFLSVDRKHVKILSMPGLETLAGITPDQPSWRESN
ncbi:fumarate/nitrate reduction transcriptional regulator Fnr [Rhabdochromatium marinum]|uniref:fumarate/nitrate reduction transcriptional regulator Fnr n=1 Tax=Rhabdochromatium marinum TaxID=48729 RepID=UPI001904B9A1|nr:fumarate/nitrate reduction transcriptional regulator Fnr [Rhabdochromatium marinum]MBK1650169.1 transcriptional regulator FNR [Rhabdochromatium marinum]